MDSGVGPTAVDQALLPLFMLYAVNWLSIGLNNRKPSIIGRPPGRPGK